MDPIMTHSQDPTVTLSQNSTGRMTAISLVNSIKYFLRYFLSLQTHFLPLVISVQNMEYTYSLGFQVFGQDTDVRANDIKVHS
jgi:hypothetical protein